MKAGTKVDYTITYLETYARPDVAPETPAGVRLDAAENPPIWYLLSLYDAVGRDYAWEDIHKREYPELAAWLHHPDTRLVTAVADGFPAGFYLLDWRIKGACEIAYFGLVPEAVGKGLGQWLLQQALWEAWQNPEIDKVMLNTCTLDHPRALPNYIKAGFTPVGTKDKSRVLSRDAALAHLSQP